MIFLGICFLVYWCKIFTMVGLHIFILADSDEIDKAAAGKGASARGCSTCGRLAII